MADTTYRGCITNDYRGILLGLIEQGQPKEIILPILRSIPDCEAVRPCGVKVVDEEVKRKHASNWPPFAYYINKAGEKVEYTSPTAMYTALTGKNVSAQVCIISDNGEQKCHANSLIDNFALSGYIVLGDDEPAPVSDEAKTDNQNLAISQEWKKHLLDTGKHFIVMSPAAPEIKEATNKAEKKPVTKKA